mgnify:CR=1 FL=1
MGFFHTLKEREGREKRGSHLSPSSPLSIYTSFKYSSNPTTVIALVRIQVKLVSVRIIVLHILFNLQNFEF